MFSVNDKIRISDLKVQIEDLKKENEKLKFANEEYQKRLFGEMSTASFAINWDTMNAFSVERMWENGLHKTVIGYMVEEPVTVVEGEVTTKDVVREWTLYCSAEKHEELVKEFREWIPKAK